MPPQRIQDSSFYTVLKTVKADAIFQMTRKVKPEQFKTRYSVLILSKTSIPY